MEAPDDRHADRDHGGLERDLEELYGVALDAFVATRDQLARSRRANGDRDGAAELRGRRKPSRAAWAMNHAVRAAPNAFDAVVAAGTALRETQQRSLEHADADALRDATRQRHDAVRAFADIAVASLRSTGEAVRPAIEETLNAASLDPEAARLVRAGQLTEELGPIDVFATLEPSATAPTRAPAARPPRAERTPVTPPVARAGPKEAARERASNAAVSKLETARSDAAAAIAELEQAEAAHSQARVGLDEAAAAVERAENAAAAARRANQSAAQRVRDARRRAAHAEQQLRRAEAAAARANDAR